MDIEMSTVPAVTPAVNKSVGMLRSMVWTQDGLMATKQNLKTGGERLGYSSRATESTEQMIGSQRS